MGFGATLEVLTSARLQDQRRAGARLQVRAGRGRGGGGARGACDCPAGAEGGSSAGQVCCREGPPPPPPPARAWSLKRPSPSVSDMEVGEGGTCAWSLGGVDPTTSLAIVFEAAGKDAGAQQAGKRHYMQLITYYQHSTAACACASRRPRGAGAGAPLDDGGRGPGPGCPSATPPPPPAPGSDPADSASLAASFDQEAAAVGHGAHRGQAHR